MGSAARSAPARTRHTGRSIGADPAGDRSFKHLHAIYNASMLVGALAPPTVAAVRGTAVGAGVNLVFATDLRIMAEDARLIAGFVGLGLHPGGGHFTLGRPHRRARGRRRAGGLQPVDRRAPGRRAGPGVGGAARRPGRAARAGDRPDGGRRPGAGPGRGALHAQRAGPARGAVGHGAGRPRPRFSCGRSSAFMIGRRRNELARGSSAAAEPGAAAVWREPHVDRARDRGHAVRGRPPRLRARRQPGRTPTRSSGTSTSHRSSSSSFPTPGGSSTRSARRGCA